MMFDTSVKYLKKFFNREIINKCLSPMFYFSIYEDGNVRYCQAFNYDIILGNIYSTDIKTIIENSSWLLSKSTECIYKDRCWDACHRRYDVKTQEQLYSILNGAKL
jgi:radical SAM protein with 4Fe4S-binding SPASM domain